jgi:hypothetical protein
MAALVVLGAVGLAEVQTSQAATAIRSGAELPAEFGNPQLQIQVNKQTLDLTGKEVQTGMSGHVLLPLRVTTEKLGYILEWKAETSSVVLRKGEQRVTLQTGLFTYESGGQTPVTLEAAPTIINDNMYVPISFFHSVLKVPVSYDEADGVILIGEESGQTTAPVSYQNTDAGFSIILPASWNGQYTVQSLAGEEAGRVQPKAQHVVRFMYPTKIPQPLLTILVFKADDWESISKEPGPPVGTVVKEYNGNVYAASLPQTNPYEKGTSQAETFNKMVLTIDQVRAAFAIWMK